MLGHLVSGYLDAEIYPKSSLVLINLHNIIVLFHMPLFMMISGYVYAVAYFEDMTTPRKKKIYKQMGNIFLVYVMFSVIFSVMKMLASAYIAKPISIMDILLIPVKPIQHLWYLYVLGVLYLLFSIKKIHTINQQVLVLLLLCLCCVSNYFEIEYFQISRIMFYAFFFYVGIMKARFSKGMAENRIRILVYCSFFLSVVLCFVYLNSIIYSGEEITTEAAPPATVLIALGISLMIWYLFEKVKCLSANRLLTVLGRCSLEIYLIHGILITGFKVVLPELGLANGYVSLMLIFLLSTLIPIVIAFICKKLGIHELIFKPLSFLKKQIGRDKAS